MSNFFEELKNRNVYKVAVAYLVSSWLIIQVVDTIGPNLNWSDSIGPLITKILIVGFPIALVLTWLYEFTPKGLKLTGKVQEDTTDNRRAGRRLNRTIIGVLAVTLCFMLVERIFFAGNTSINSRQEASIAVLPFENLSLEEEYSFYANAVPARIINELAVISGLQVINRTSSFAVKKSINSTKEMGEVLDVNYLLDGDLQYDPRSKRIRVSAHLINANNGYITWSDTFEDNIGQLQDIQKVISRKVAAELKVQLLPGEDEALYKKITENSDVYKLYLQAKELGQNRTDPDLEKAINLLDQTLEIEPGFAQAHAELSYLYGQKYRYGNISKEERDRSIKYHLDEAIELGPELPEVLAAKATYEMRILEDYGNIVEDLQRAIQLKPGDAQMHYLLYDAFLRTREPEQAAEALNKVLQLDPGNSFYNAMLARHVFWTLNEPEKAIAILDRQLLIDPDAPNANRLALFKALFISYEPSGDLVEAFKISHRNLKKDATSGSWNLNYSLMFALDLDLLPWAEKLGRTIQLQMSDSRGLYHNISALYAFKRDWNAYKELIEYSIEQGWLEGDDIVFERSWTELMLGNTKEAIVIFEDGFPNMANGQELSEGISPSNYIKTFNYIELLLANGQEEKANILADKLCKYDEEALEEDPNRFKHWTYANKLNCYYFNNNVKKFVEELEPVFFEKKDRVDWFKEMKMGYYFLFEDDPAFQKLFKKIEAETHRMRAEVIAYLKEEGDWDPAWDKELGLED